MKSIYHIPVVNLFFPLLILSIFLVVFPRDIQLFFVNGFMLFFISSYFLSKSKDAKSVAILSIPVVITLVFGSAAYFVIKFHKQFTNEAIAAILPFITISALVFSLALISGYQVRYRILTDQFRTLILYSIILNTLMINSGKLGWPMQFTAGGIIYSIGGLILGSNNRRWNLLAQTVISGPLFIIMLLLLFIEMHYHLLPLIIIIPIATLVGLFIKQLLINNKKSVILPIIVIVSVMFYLSGYVFTLNWCDYIFSLDSNSSVNQHMINFQTKEGIRMNEDSLKGKVTLFYFWNSSCTVCIKKMPELEKLSRQYSDLPDFQIFAIFIPVSNFDTSGIVLMNKLYKKYDINFAISQDDMRAVMSNYNFRSFPHTVLINEKGEILYNGRFNNNPLSKIDNINRYLKKSFTVITKN